MREDIRPQESNFDHVLDMYQISRELMNKFPEEFEGVDVEKMLIMIGLHDIGELNKEGDIPATEKHGDLNLHREIERREKITSYVVLKKIKNVELRKELVLILEEYELRDSKESKLVKMIDIVQASRKYSESVVPKLEDQDFEKAKNNLRDVQISNFLNKGINNIANEFPGVSEYVKNDFILRLEELSKKIPDLEKIIELFKKDVKELIG